MSNINSGLNSDITSNVILHYIGVSGVAMVDKNRGGGGAVEVVWGGVFGC